MVFSLLGHFAITVTELEVGSGKERWAAQPQTKNLGRHFNLSILGPESGGGYPTEKSQPKAIFPLTLHRNQWKSSLYVKPNLIQGLQVMKSTVNEGCCRRQATDNRFLCNFLHMICCPEEGRCV